MLPEWGRFVTAVKLNKGLKDSNFDQLYAYLKQHEAHANENKMMLERLTQQTVDPLALMSNFTYQHIILIITNHPTHSINLQSADPSQSDRDGRQNRDRVPCTRQGAAGLCSRGMGYRDEDIIVPSCGLDNANMQEDVDEQPVQDLALNVDNVFQADDCDAYDSDVDDAPTAQTLFMANLSSADPV
ncbi:hypothetical protein Tco_1577164 [Tanacetum coccineum]